jgi:hypothetical protein
MPETITRFPFLPPRLSTRAAVGRRRFDLAHVL